MTPYLSVFFILYLFAFIDDKIRSKKIHLFLLLFISTLLVIFIGFRYSVGGDWATYLNNVERFRYHDFYTALYTNEFLWTYLNVFSNYFNFGIVGINFFAALIFIFSLTVLNKKFSNNLYIFMLAFPYFIILVSMGFTRQCIALSFLLLSLSVDKPFKDIKILLLLTAGIFFHNSIIFVFWIPFLYKPLINKFKLFMLFIIILMIFFLVFNSVIAFNYYFQYFYNQAVNAEGAKFRLLFNLIPAILYIINSKNFFRDQDYIIWLSVSLLNIVLFILLIRNILPSAMIDRLLVYISIVQLVVFIKLFNLYKNNFREIFIVLTSSLFFIFMTGWFIFGNNSKSWIPYDIKIHSDNNWVVYRIYKFSNCPHCFRVNLDKIKNKDLLFDSITNERIPE